MPKAAYPHPEDDVRISQLMQILKEIDLRKEKVAKELRTLIYKAEVR
jgi:hypothetical protein